MKVVLLKDLKGTGKKDQVIEVSDGYARNYLLPRNLAKEASNTNLNAIQNQKQAEAHRKEALRQEAISNAESINKISVTIPAKLGKDSRLFGSIGVKEIADALAAQHGIEADKKKIVLDTPIKALGEYTVEIRLFPSVISNLKVIVVAE